MSMDLIANNEVPDFPSTLLHIDDIYWKLDLASQMDPKFRKALHTSLSESGMEWPIIVWPIDHYAVNGDFPNPKFADELKERAKPYVCGTGSNRCQFATMNGYDRISAIIMTTQDEIKTIRKTTVMKYHEDF